MTPAGVGSGELKQTTYRWRAGAACAQLPPSPRSCGNLDSPKLARRGGQTLVQMAVRLHSRLHPG
jgi:hypothetical protein